VRRWDTYKLGTYIMPPEPISTAYIINTPHQWYQHYSISNCWRKPLILLKRLYQSLNLVHISSAHLNGVHHKSLSSVIPKLQPPTLYCFIDFITHTYWFSFYFSSSQVFVCLATGQ
jgi:hypothetical protein